MADPKIPDAEAPLDPALERHLADPAEMTEQVSGEQARAKPAVAHPAGAHEAVPTDPAVDTENQPS